MIAATPQLLAYTTVDGVVYGRHPLPLGDRLLPPAGGVRAPGPDRAELQPGDRRRRDDQRDPALPPPGISAAGRADRPVPASDHAGPADARLRQEQARDRLRRDLRGQAGAREDRQALDQVSRRPRSGASGRRCRTSPSPSALTFKDAAFQVDGRRLRRGQFRRAVPDHLAAGLL